MKAIVVEHAGDAETLRLLDVSTPSPGPGEVTIDVRFAGVGLVDTLLRRGHLEVPFGGRRSYPRSGGRGCTAFCQASRWRHGSISSAAMPRWRLRGPISSFLCHQLTMRHVLPRCWSMARQLEEGGSRRRMMSVSAHDRISGTPQMVRVWDQFLSYAKGHPGVVFMRKDDIARYVLESAITVRELETI